MNLITASQLTRHCGYKRKLSKERPRSENAIKAQAKGSSFHECAEVWLRGSEGPLPIDREVKGWVAWLRDIWTPPPGCTPEMPLGLSPEGRYVEVKEPEPHVYVPVVETPLLTAGRADVVWHHDGIAHVLDFKTGKFPVDAPKWNLQLLSLGFAAASFYGSDVMKVGIYYARKGTFVWSDPIHLDSDEAASMWGAVETAATLDETPRPGPHCSRCWERKGCAFAAL